MCSCKNCLPNLKSSTTIFCPCPPPRKLLTSSSWITRNDSSNVNAILHPECFPPRLKFGEKTRGHVTQKHILSRNTCYCLDKKAPKPSLFTRPNSCISYRRFGPDGLEDDRNLNRRSLTCICSTETETEVNETVSKHRSSSKNENAAVEDRPLEYTDQREQYEEFRGKEEERFQTEVEEYRTKEKSSSLVDKQTEESVRTILGTQNYASETATNSQDGTSTSEKFAENENILSSRYKSEVPKYHAYTVPEFRKEYYFETHDIDKGFSENRRNHTCVHQFKLSDRWRADPVNKDAFGRSKCKICDKVMEGSSVNLSTSYLFDDKKSDGSRIKNFGQAYKHGLAPRTINLGRGKSRIELIVNEKDLDRLTGYVDKNQRPQFSNSLALRHQKMRAL